MDGGVHCNSFFFFKQKLIFKRQKKTGYNRARYKSIIPRLRPTKTEDKEPPKPQEPKKEKTLKQHRWTKEFAKILAAQLICLNDEAKALISLRRQVKKKIEIGVDRFES